MFPERYIVMALFALFPVAASWLIFVYKLAQAKNRQHKAYPLKLSAALPNLELQEVAKALTNNRDGHKNRERPTSPKIHGRKNLSI